MNNKFIKYLFLLLSYKISFSQISENVQLLKNIDDYSSYSACWGYEAPDGREYAILGCNNGTSIIDITDEENIHEVGFIDGGSGIREMKCYSHYCYIVSEASNSGLQIVDLQYLPDSVQLLNTFYFPNYETTHTISQSGPYLYLNGGNYGVGGISVLDLTLDPINPTKRGEWETYYVHDCRISSDTIWACNIYEGLISIIDATNKDSLKTITSFSDQPYPFPHNCAFTKDKKCLLTTDETSDPPGKLKFWNIEDLDNIYLMTDWRPANNYTSIVHNVETFGDTAYVAHYSAGLRILDISNPEIPVEIGYYDTYPNNDNTGFVGCWGAYKFPSGKIIASDIQSGMFVFKMGKNVSVNSNNTQSSFFLEQNFPNPFNPITTIKYIIPDKEKVKLSVYNVLGKEIQLIINEVHKPGSYEIKFNGSNLSNGIYFYKLQAGNFSEIKKMILIK